MYTVDLSLKEADRMVLISAFLALDRSRVCMCACMCLFVSVCTRTFKLFMIHRANSDEPESLLSMLPCLLVGVEGMVGQGSWPFK